MTNRPETTHRPETIAVVVVTYNSARFLPDLFASLGPGLGGLRWHLTVADNASSDDTLAVLRAQVPDARIVETGRNGGYAAGINAAVAAAAPHDAVLVLNPDVRLAADCVPELLAVLRRRGAGIAVPRIVRANGEFSPSLRREPTILRALGDALFGAERMGRIGSLGEVITDRRWYAEETSVDWAEGSIMLIDRACWDACGAWDESFFLYSEETEFALRARPRLRHGARSARPGAAPGGWIWDLTAAVGATHAQPCPALPQAPQPARRRRLLGADPAPRDEPRRPG